ncbi:16S rRNA (guanine(527)-N(7))-methyltransferase RsmG [Lactobacillus sp. ESL0233]|uniref:16S rRNA (guanine(527)-N(7))-methyltransferase RsmG n=1 Tax=Lactobacillus sp. ESL0233 TaxID=2069354 RepID=UPI000EFC3672|nr:16S rRNA (guanine(527)-N(7))-methyltransferase RsmG [Lactobacillus sp. ESL0233]RMC42523.1 16S rRNA (guanine(527)-N(7))-methyltransferase RsmG [Lactobacillus sp. ESL0233]
MNPEQFVHELSKCNCKLNEKQINQFKQYFTNLVAANQHVNLTRITAESDVYLKHFFDSITPLLVFNNIFKNESKICDVGAGAGFPSIPLKIVQPEINVTIVDSLGKRLTFLQNLIEQLKLEDVTLVHSRAEDIGQDKLYREQFDIVTARAVANMAVLSEYCLPLVKKGGYLVALKGPKAESELSAAKKAIALLGGKLLEVKDLQLPNSSEERTLILVQKTKETPKKYPRQAGTPHRKPIH